MELNGIIEDYCWNGTYPEPGYLPYNYAPPSSTFIWREAKVNIIIEKDMYILNLSGAPEDYNESSFSSAWDIESEQELKPKLIEYMIQMGVPEDVPIIFPK